MTDADNRNKQERRASPVPWLGLAWDSLVIVLVVVNLALIVFDSLFAVPPVAAGIAAVSASFHDWYAQAIHARFAVIDLYFVAIFATDVLLGWAVAVYERRYHRWFFYPFVHWYDVLGCIPLAGFRFLRALRLIALAVRLQRMGLIDVRRWRLYGFFGKYYDIVMEELSDRVVVKVLDGIQTEVRRGTDLPDRIVREVLQPRSRPLATAISGRIDDAVSRTYNANRDEIQAYLGDLVHRAVEDNGAVQNLERVPMLGGYIGRTLDRAIREAVTSLLDDGVASLSSAEFASLIEHLTDSVLAMLQEPRAQAGPESREMVIEIIELLKEQTQVQRWKDVYG